LVLLDIYVILWPCSKVSIPVDKAIGLMHWVQSLGFEVPELAELCRLRKRCSPSHSPPISCFPALSTYVVNLENVQESLMLSKLVTSYI
jgi:hypothetical protein